MYRSNEFLKLLYILPWRKIFSAIYGAKREGKFADIRSSINRSKSITYMYTRELVYFS